MNVAVLVPRRPEPWRDKLWGFVRYRLLAEVDWPLHEGFDDGEGPVNRSQALNRAAVVASDWEAAVILDADTVIDPGRVQRGLELASENGTLVLPHTEFRSLTRRATRAVLEGVLEPEDAPTRWVKPNTKSSCLCIGRELWDEAGGFDERFVGWGAEDAAFYAACQALAGIERLEGPVYHLWHPRSPEKNPKRDEYRANFALGARYKAARRDPDAMREILAERP